MKKYNSFLGAFFSGDNGQGGYNAGYRQSALAKLYDSSAAPEEQQAAQAGLMRVDPDAALKWQTDNETRNKAMVADSAKLLVSLGKDNPLAAQAWQTRIKPQLVKMYGEQAASLPDLPDDSIMAYAQQLAGGGQAKARSAHILEDGTIAYMDEYGKLVRTGEKASNNFRPLIGANGEVTGFDPRGNTATPTMLGTPGADQGTQQNPPPEQKDTDQMAPHIARINADGEALRRYGLPQDQVNAWMDNQFAEAQKSVQQNGVVIGQQGTPQAPPVRQPVPQAPMGGGQARVSVKPEAGITPYQEETLRLQREQAARAEAEAKAKADERKAAADAKAQERQARIVSAQQTTDNLLSNIQELKKHPGFKQLGTVGGNATNAALPEWVPTEYRGAQARLDTIKGQVAIQALAELKTLSANGASGFGALSEKELALLQNSIQTLTTSQINSDILSAMNQIETLLKKAKTAPVRPAAPPPAATNSGTQRRVGKYIILED